MLLRSYADGRLIFQRVWAHLKSSLALLIEESCFLQAWETFGWYLFDDIFLCIFFLSFYHFYNLDFGISGYTLYIFILFNSTLIFFLLWYICSPSCENISVQFFNPLIHCIVCFTAIITSWLNFSYLFHFYSKSSRKYVSCRCNILSNLTIYLFYTFLLINFFLGGVILFVIAWLLCYWLS